MDIKDQIIYEIKTIPHNDSAGYDQIAEKIADSILARVVKALRVKAGTEGDYFICGGCLMDVCKFLGEVGLYD